MCISKFDVSHMATYGFLDGFIDLPFLTLSRFILYFSIFDDSFFSLIHFFLVFLFYAAQMVPFKDEMKIIQVPVVVAVSCFFSNCWMGALNFLVINIFNLLLLVVILGISYVRFSLLIYFRLNIGC